MFVRTANAVRLSVVFCNCSLTVALQALCAVTAMAGAERGLNQLDHDSMQSLLETVSAVSALLLCSVAVVGCAQVQVT